MTLSCEATHPLIKLAVNRIINNLALEQTPEQLITRANLYIESRKRINIPQPCLHPGRLVAANNGTNRTILDYWYKIRADNSFR